MTNVSQEPSETCPQTLDQSWPCSFQYSKVEEFLADLRKMFRNCYTFHDKSSDYYTQAKTLEERLDEVESTHFVAIELN